MHRKTIKNPLTGILKTIIEEAKVLGVIFQEYWIEKDTLITIDVKPDDQFIRSYDYKIVFKSDSKNKLDYLSFLYKKLCKKIENLPIEEVTQKRKYTRKKRVKKNEN